MNTFSNCPLYGIYSMGTGNNVILRDANGWQYGRNTMLAPIYTSGAASADMAKVQNGELTVSCGRNLFELTSLPPNSFHIINLDPALYPIDVESNSWQPGATVKQVNCNPSGTPLNDASTTPNVCGNRVDDSPPATCSQPSCCTSVNDPYPPTADWFTMDSSSSELTSACINACAMMLSDTIDPITRALKARDALWSASLTDSSSTYLPFVKTNYTALIADPLATAELKSTVWMLKGTIDEKMGNSDSAIACYDTVITNYHEYIDSVYALWNLQRLSIPDTTPGATDSARGAFSQREYADLLAMIDTIAVIDTGAHKIATGEPVPADSGLDVTVHPNPSGTYARICVADLPANVPASVVVVNEAGQVVATLYNATPEAELGLCLTLDCSKLPSGTYYARISNSLMGRAVKLSVEH